MLNRIIEWSARNVFLVLLGTVFIVGAGIYALVKTPLDAIPDLSDVQVIIYTDRKSTRLNSSHIQKSRMPSSA